VKVLVTGGRGFIGTATVDLLASRGHEPVIFDHRLRLGEHETILGDIRDAVAVELAVAHCDAVIHLAGVLGTQETVRNPRPAFDVNITGALNVFEAVSEHGVPAVNICVGNHFMDNPYAISKSTTERLAQFYNNDRGTRIANVRAFNAYGHTQAFPAPWGHSKIRKILPSMVGAVLHDTPITIYGDGEQVMDMIHVDDVARVLLLALEEGPPMNGKPYEAGSGVPTTVNDVAQLVIDTLGTGTIDYEPMRPGESKDAVVLADTTRLQCYQLDPIHPNEGIPAVVERYANQ
jgi:nucleoside-diphosphate-sugar epimerase